MTEVKSERIAPYGLSDPLRIPRERYFDREFYEWEKEKLWPHVWQVACRLEELPDPGDFVEYEICGMSILVVRQRDGSVKAFENACRHRATQLGVDSGRFSGGQIVCPFHGWRWNLDGSNSFLYGYDEVARPECVSGDDLRLRECLAEVWGGCVWINMDRDARPLMDALAPAAAILDGLSVGSLRVRYWKEVVFKANWKVAQEAFMEGLHAMQTHPQLTYAGGQDPTVAKEDRLTYTAFENGHGQFAGSPKDGYAQKGQDREQFMEGLRLLWEGQPMTGRERDYRLFEGLLRKVPPEEDFVTAAVRAYYDYAEGAGIPVGSDEFGLAKYLGGELFLFPNVFFLPLFGTWTSYRSRPYNDDPEWCRFEVWSLQMFPEGREPSGRPVVERYEKDDEEHWGQIPPQDFSNIEREQKGFRTRGFDSSRLYPENEKLISNMHQELDRYLTR